MATVKKPVTKVSAKVIGIDEKFQTIVGQVNQAVVFMATRNDASKKFLELKTAIKEAILNDSNLATRLVAHFSSDTASLAYKFVTRLLKKRAERHFDVSKFTAKVASMSTEGLKAKLSELTEEIKVVTELLALHQSKDKKLKVA